MNGVHCGTWIHVSVECGVGGIGREQLGQTASSLRWCSTTHTADLLGTQGLAVSGAIKKVQTEHKLSTHAVAIRGGQTGSEERQEEDTY